jgi:tetratricopeptide (TPR) repeat protein
LPVSALSAARQPDIVGRTDVLAAFEHAVGQLRAAGGRVLFVAGEPGIGKTSVLQAAATRARDDGAVVRWATCPEDDAAPPYWPLTQLLEHPADERLAAAITQLTQIDESGSDVRHRFGLMQEVAGALRRVAQDTPQVLIVDDLHWADRSTLRLLTFLVRQLGTAPILISGGYRDTDLGPDHPLLDLLGEAGAAGQTLTLEGLTAPEVADLARRAGVAEPSAADAEHLREHTGGNPFFVLNAARLVLAESRSSGGDLQLNLPAGVRAVLERRLARLSQPCHALLRTAAAVGAQFDVALVAAVSGLSTVVTDQLLGEAVEARLATRLPGGEYAFAHALVRATAYEQITPAQKHTLHGEAADAVRTAAGQGGRLAEIAHHELRAEAERAATAGVDAAMAAADHAMAMRAFEEAAEFYGRAAAATQDRARAVQARLAAGMAHRLAGDWDVANEVYLAAATDARALHRGDLLAQAALGVGADSSGFEVRSYDRRQLALLEEALASVGDEDPRLRAHLLARRAVAAGSTAAVAHRQQWADEAVALGRGDGDARVLTYALSAWCDVHAGPAHAEQRLAAADEMLAASHAVNDIEGVLLARRFRVVALLERGDPAVHAEIDAYARESNDLGLPLYTWYVSLWRGMQAHMRGDFAAALQRVAEVTALGVEAGSENAYVLASTLQSGVMFDRGEIVTLAAMYRQAFEQFPYMMESPTAVAMTPVIAVAEGRPEQARADLDALAATGFSALPQDSEWISSLTAVIWSAVILNHQPTAAVLYPLLLPHAGRFGVDGIGAVCLDPVDHLLGALAEILGRHAEAMAHYEHAAAMCRRLGAPLLAAHSDYALGHLRAEAGQPGGGQLMAGARRVLDEAGDVYPNWLTVADVATPGSDPEAATESTGTFRLDGATWEVTFGGRTTRLPDAKGMHDLRYLLTHPGQSVPAVQLQRAGSDASDDGVATRGVEALDDHAREAYRRRLADLDGDIAQAEKDHDTGRAAAARDEREFLLAELSAAVGLGGRSRRLGDDADRARKAVTMRIRNAIARIRREHPELGRHLERGVKTGGVCSYDPEHACRWTV